jgi:hypothetical protein
MAKYTMELRKIIESSSEEEVISWFTDYELSDYLTQDEIDVINERGTWSKEKLAKMIIDHYFVREIGYETVGLFKHFAKVAMREIMEEKLPLIYSASIKYDPLVNVDFTETYTGKSSGSSSSKSDGINIHSDTPQSRVSKTDILNGEYASSTDGNELSDSNTSAGTEDYTKTTRGNSGVSATAQKMIQQYRENIVMINRDIIKDLASLFMGVY